MSLYKSSVVAGVVIPHYVKLMTASTGLSWCFFYGSSKMFTSKYGVKPPDRARRFMNGTAMFNVYDINARTRDMDMEMIAKMRARMFPVRFFVIANSLFMVGGLYAITRQLKAIE